MVKEKVDEAIETFIDNPSPQVSYHDLITRLCELNKKDFKRIIKNRKIREKIQRIIRAILQLRKITTWCFERSIIISLAVSRLNVINAAHYA